MLQGGGSVSGDQCGDGPSEKSRRHLRSEVVNVVSKTEGKEREKSRGASGPVLAVGRGAPAARMRAAGGGVGGTQCAWFWCKGVQQ